MNPVLVAILGVVAGVMFVALSVFCVFLIISLYRVRATLEAFQRQLAAVSGLFAGLPQDFLPRIFVTLKQLPEGIAAMGSQLQAVNQTIQLFNQFIFNKRGPTAGEQPPDESGVYTYDEGTQHDREVMSRARAAGYPVDTVETDMGTAQAVVAAQNAGMGAPPPHILSVDPGSLELGKIEVHIMDGAITPP